MRTAQALCAGRWFCAWSSGSWAPSFRPSWSTGSGITSTQSTTRLASERYIKRSTYTLGGMLRVKHTVNTVIWFCNILTYPTGMEEAHPHGPSTPNTSYEIKICVTGSYCILFEMLLGCCLHSYNEFLLKVDFEMWAS